MSNINASVTILGASLTLLLSVLAVGCTEHNPVFCDKGSCAHNEVNNFCDIDGVSPESTVSETCIASPGEGACNRVEVCQDKGKPYCSDLSSGECFECLEQEHCSNAQQCNLATHTCNDIIYVTSYRTGSDSDDWDCAVDKGRKIPFFTCPTIQKAIDSVRPNRNTILVSHGTYVESLTIYDGQIQLRAKDDGVIIAPILTGENPIGIRISSGSQVRMSGFTIQPSSQDSSLTEVVRCDTSGVSLPTLTMENVSVITNSHSAISAHNCNLTLKHSLVTNGRNLAVSFRGYSDMAPTLRIETTRFDTVRALDVRSASYSIENSTFTILPAEPEKENTFMRFSDTTGLKEVLQFNTIVAKQIKTPSHITCVNSQLVANSNIIVGQDLEESCSMSYSLVQGVFPYPGKGNIKVLPNFRNPAIGNYSLRPGSAGINQAAPKATLTTDKDGDVRPQGSRHDIGADEAKVL